MGIKDYFSGSEIERARFIFDFIAPVYNFFDSSLVVHYKKIALELNANISLSELSILDVGTGTGSWLDALGSFSNKHSTGVDLSDKMLKIAKNRHSQYNFINSDATTLNNIADKSYDIVTASFVMHGFKQQKRADILTQLKRISRKYVIINDFYGKTNASVAFLEFLERSDYKNFKLNFNNEMNEFFNKTEIMPSNSGSALYIGTI
ncbi:MAG: class I SAM-dependent methyltransferase [Deltaproteobacteria bacterium]|nr:class I SAM-dependent methyltransferase [Deltaproteobacteria bacterium]